MRRMPIRHRRSFPPIEMPRSGLRGISRDFSRLFPCGGQVAYVLLTRAPVAGGVQQADRPAAPRLACVKPVASVHPEPGSNSSLLISYFYFFLFIRPWPNSSLTHDAVFSTCPRWRPIYSFNLFWKFFLTRTMFSGLHLSLSLTVVNCFLSQSFQRSVSLSFRSFPKASAKLVLLFELPKFSKLISWQFLAKFY